MTNQVIPVSRLVTSIHRENIKNLHQKYHFEYVYYGFLLQILKPSGLQATPLTLLCPCKSIEQRIKRIRGIKCAETSYHQSSHTSKIIENEIKKKIRYLLSLTRSRDLSPLLYSSENDKYSFSGRKYLLKTACNDTFNKKLIMIFQFATTK